MRGRGGGREELPCFQGQGRPGEATACLRPGAVALRSHTTPKARGGSREEQRKEQWLEPSHTEGQEGQQ